MTTNTLNSKKYEILFNIPVEQHTRVISICVGYVDNSGILLVLILGWVLPLYSFPVNQKYGINKIKITKNYNN